MGCRITKNDSVSNDEDQQHSTATMSKYHSNDVDYKAKLERKICLVIIIYLFIMTHYDVIFLINLTLQPVVDVSLIAFDFFFLIL